ncbi:MAG TPA: hypothetical protein VIU64_18855 [Polyangia bacterium]
MRRASPLLPIRPTWWPLALLAMGCGPTLATLQPAHVAPAGHVQVAAGFEVGVPTGTVVHAVDAGRALSSRARGCNDQSCQLTPDEKGQLYGAGVSLTASPLSYSQHLAVSYGFDGRVEAGLRWAAGNWRAQGRYQLARAQDGPFDATAGLGVSYSSTGVPMGDVLPVLKVDDFSRWTVDVPLTIGTSRSWCRVWTGVKLAYTRFDTKMHLELPSDDVSLASFDGHGLYVLGQGGVAFGYRYLFLAVELTLGELFGHADAAVAGASPVAGARSTDLTGFVVYPAVALIGEI